MLALYHRGYAEYAAICTYRCADKLIKKNGCDGSCPAAVGTRCVSGFGVLYHELKRIAVHTFELALISPCVTV